MGTPSGDEGGGRKEMMAPHALVSQGQFCGVTQAHMYALLFTRTRGEVELSGSGTESAKPGIWTMFELLWGKLISEPVHANLDLLHTESISLFHKPYQLIIIKRKK